MGKVTAVVINRNTREYLRACLESLEAQDVDGGVSVWVVDNGSSDGSAAMVLEKFPRVNLVLNDGNVGYGRACNQGASKTSEPYVLLLNSDTLLSPGTARELVGYLEAHPDVGIAGPRILNTDGTLQYSCRDFPSIPDALVHGFLGLFNGGNRASARYKKTGWAHDEEAEVDWVSGCFLAVRRSAFEELGGFDESYYMYVEDVDLCWRAWRSGWKVAYLPAGDVCHHIGMSSRVVPARMVFHHHASMLRFHFKTYRGPARATVAVAVAAGVLTRFLLIMALNGLYRLRAALGGVRRVIMPGRQ